MNCSQAAASRLRNGTGWNSPSRARSCSLTSRGLGSSRSARRDGTLKGHVASKAGADHAHVRVLQVVEAAVAAARPALALVGSCPGCRGRHGHGQLVRIPQVPGAQAQPNGVDADVRPGSCPAGARVCACPGGGRTTGSGVAKRIISCPHYITFYTLFIHLKISSYCFAGVNRDGTLYQNIQWIL